PMAPRNPYQSAFRNDAEALAFFQQQQLQYLDPAVYNVEHAEVEYAKHIPVDTSIPRGAESIAYDMYDRLGMAQWLAADAEDLPVVNVSAKRLSSPIKDFGTAYQYSEAELEAAAFSGVPLDVPRAEAARMAIEEFHEQVALFGAPEVGLLGFARLPNANVYTCEPGAGAGNPTEWTDKEPAEILKDLNNAANLGPILTKNVAPMRPNRMLLDLDRFTLIATTKLSEASDTTILEFFTSKHPWVKTVEPWPRLAEAGTSGTRLGIVYRADPRALRYRTGIQFEQAAPQVRGFKTKVPCRANSAGVQCMYPLSVTYISGH
ncbi:major capsid family protein, partial [Corallococcus exiguus]|uniref:major capsid family protein n=1 Tax=Corallococcus exiguus TaxID=83462 RepID=UPI0014723106